MMLLSKKNLILFILSFSLISSFNMQGATAAPLPKNGKEESKWQKYKEEGSGFSVEFPKSPQHDKQKIDIPKTHLSINYETYVSEPKDSIVYVISVWHYPSEIDMSKPEVNLQDGFSGMLSALPSAKVLNMQMNDYNGFKSLDFTVKNDDVYFQGKLILVFNTLYQVFTVYKESELEAMKDNYKKFISSFKLLNPEQHKAKEGVDASTKMNV